MNSISIRIEIRKAIICIFRANFVAIGIGQTTFNITEKKKKIRKLEMAWIKIISLLRMRCVNAHIQRHSHFVQ